MPEFARVAVLAVALYGLVGCASSGYVKTRLDFDKGTPRDAAVTIDEEYYGPLYMVSAYGVKLRTGTHRISVEKDGYFPWDQLVVADRQQIIRLKVVLTPIPD
jgi:hypothetical protein